MRVPGKISGAIKEPGVQGPEGTYVAFASFYELYNEKVYDPVSYTHLTLPTKA